MRIPSVHIKAGHALQTAKPATPPPMTGITTSVRTRHGARILMKVSAQTLRKLGAIDGADSLEVLLANFPRLEQVVIRKAARSGSNIVEIREEDIDWH